MELISWNVYCVHVEPFGHGTDFLVYVLRVEPFGHGGDLLVCVLCIRAIYAWS